LKISIRGPIIPSNHQWIYDWLGMEATSPKKVAEQLAKANNEDLEVEINSGGGSVFDASEIYTALKDYPGYITGKIVGIAASAASVIAMGVDKLLMSPTAQMMIHNAKGSTSGDYRDMDHMSGVLKNVNKTIANAYSLKTGKPYEELLSLMDGETWMTPQQALELNFIDGIMFDDEAKMIAASANETQMLPQQVIDKIRNEFKKSDFIQNSVETNKKEETKVLTIEQLKNEYPDLYNQVVNEGREAGILAERERIKAINDIAIPGNEEIINKAKFETGITAEQVALEIIKAEKQRSTNFLNNREKDAQDLNNVEPSAVPQEEKDAQNKKAAEDIAAAINKRRGK
jgi:ATP-dependent protease ClpP protease subunit